MKIPCFRCGTELDTPGSHNADYIMAEDTKAIELREHIIVLVHNKATLAKLAKILKRDNEGHSLYPDLVIEDMEYDRIIVSKEEEIIEAGQNKQVIKTLLSKKPESVQKTGIVCPACYKPTDIVIWGVHKQSSGNGIVRR